MQTAQQTNRLDFLFTAGFQMVSTVPALSRYYMNEFHNTLAEFELTTPKTIDRLACKSCGQISLPGLSSRVEIRSKRKQKNKKRQNVIQNSCTCCGNTRLYHGSHKKKLPQIVTTTVPVVTIDKKKKNKGKKNSLKAMLTKSTQQQQQQQKPSSSLSDFLSFL